MYGTVDYDGESYNWPYQEPNSLTCVDDFEDSLRPSGRCSECRDDSDCEDGRICFYETFCLEDGEQRSYRHEPFRFDCWPAREIADLECQRFDTIFHEPEEALCWPRRFGGFECSECRTDSDCPDDFICTAEQSLCAECREDSDCGDDEYCSYSQRTFAGICEPYQR